jgi:membrane fusion protein (multidrug efflux system)
MSLDGFPWTQFGMLKGSVRSVSGEVRDGSVRVEIALSPDSESRVPRQHGLPGRVEIQVEQITPASLIWRTAGTLISKWDR